MANIATGLAYFHIPFEIWMWTRGRDLKGLQYIAWLFVAFIVACGSHHLWMVGTSFHHHALGFGQVFIDSAMAVVSLACSYVLYSLRSKIRTALGRVLKW